MKKEDGRRKIQEGRSKKEDPRRKIQEGRWKRIKENADAEGKC
jgi:hypothetical protein